MPRRSGFPVTLDAWLPLSQMPGIAATRRETRTLRVFARLRDGVDLNDGRLEVSALADRMAREHPDSNRGLRARVLPINERFLGSPTNPAWLAFLSASFIVLIVSSANVANLMIAQAALRTRELAVRASLGASRGRIVRHMLIESMVLAAIGTVVGLGVSLAAVRAFRSAIPENTLPYWIDYAMDARVFGALLLVASATVVVFGLLPAVQASRTDINRVLKDGGPSGSGTVGARRWTTAFLTAQFALTVVLLANAAVSIRSGSPQVASDVIVKSTSVLTAAVTLPPAKYGTPEQRAAFYRSIDERIRGIAGIEEVSAVSVLPGHGGSEQRLEVEGREQAAGENAPSVWVVSIAPHYFQTLAVRLQRGRDFAADDGEPGREYAIVNQRFVEMFLPDRDPVDARISVLPSTSQTNERKWLTIAGVAQDIRQRPTPTVDPVVYLPLRAAPPATATVMVRSRIGPTALAQRIREELLALDPNLPLYRVLTLASAINEAEWNGRISARLLLTITLIALGLSVVGLYASTAHAVVQRRRELGIRIALGANAWQLRWLVVRRATVQVSVGLFAGLLCTLAWDAAFPTGRADARFASFGNLAPTALLLAATVLLACVVPARRATRTDPLTVLRDN